VRFQGPGQLLAARKGIRTGLMGERFGGQVLDTVDIENYISVPKTEGASVWSRSGSRSHRRYSR
jgi:alkyl hydroperoxide reductase subunit AhpF